MKKIFIGILLCLCSCLVGTTYALPPAGPITRLTWGDIQQDSNNEGTQVAKLQWADDSNATGYSLLYFYYDLGFPDDSAWNKIDLGKVTSISVPLPIGSAYWAAVQSYNAEGVSSINSVHPVIVKPVVILAPRIVALVNRDAERDGLLAGFKQFNKQFGNVSLDIVKWDTPETVTDQVSDYLADPNVIALITSDTASTLRATQSPDAEQCLIVAVDATSTILKEHNNVLQIAASNDTQVKTIRDISRKSAAQHQRMERYAVIMEESPDTAVHNFDLYLSLLKQAFESEITDSSPSRTATFSQLVGTFNFDGDSAQATMIGESLAAQKPDVVLYLGSAENFSILYAKATEQIWLASDSVYDLIPQGFKSDFVKIMTLGSPDPGKGIYYSAYDTIGVLGQVLNSIKSSLTRQSILEAARQMTPYEGATGIKTFTETDYTGWYDLLTSTSSGWEVVATK